LPLPEALFDPCSQVPVLGGPVSIDPAQSSPISLAVPWRTSFLYDKPAERREMKSYAITFSMRREKAIK
jgi:hypothetical protein